VAHDEHDHDAHEHEHERGEEHEHEPEEEARERAEKEARRRLALAQIRQYGDPALRLIAHDVEDFDDDLRRLVDRMIVLMHDAQGVGLAATQVGVLRRLFVFEPDDEGPRAIVNPVVVEREEEAATDDEGCLSLQGVKVPVERSTRIVLEGKDPNGEDVRLELDEYGARVVQHELDHLDGVLIIDRTDDEHRKEALATLRPRAVLR
jgi:peptide deformylase